MKDTVSHVSDIANESNVSSFSIPVKLWVFDWGGAEGLLLERGGNTLLPSS